MKPCSYGMHVAVVVFTSTINKSLQENLHVYKHSCTTN